jgi:hypothetical protein
VPPKCGRLKYDQQFIKQTLAEIEEFKLMMLTIFARMKSSFNFEQPLIERVVCSYVDWAILWLFFEAGSHGFCQKIYRLDLEHLRLLASR